MQITVQNRQTLLDIALQELGSAEAVFELAVVNNCSITGDLDAGRVLDIPAVSQYVRRQIADYYRVNGINPATQLDDTMSFDEGIGEWEIENDFTVS
jgi:hypothetical protein